jgi:GT2 family glycosyltransferase
MLTPSPAAVAYPRAPVRTDCSVIIVAYNQRADLARCLASLRESTDAEIIVVDNGSSDGTADYLAGEFPEVRLVRSQENLGFGGANNLAAGQAAGRYLAFLNPDTVVTPGWLGALVAALERDPSAGLATSKVLLLPDPERTNTCGNDVHLTGLTLCRGLGAPRDAFDEPAEVAAVSGAAFAIRRELFERLGGFDADFFLYLEDTDLSLRARLAGYRCLYVPDSIVYHDYRLRFGPRKTYYQERNRYLMLLKCYRWRTLLALLPALALAEVVTWGFVVLWDRRRFLNKVAGYGWIIRHWSEVMQKRAETQALRRVNDAAVLVQSAWKVPYDQAGSGLAACLARAVFDPLFLLWGRLILRMAARSR